MRYILCGSGKMGNQVKAEAEKAGWTLLGVADQTNADWLLRAPGADVCIDFSHPQMFSPLEQYIQRTKTPLCCGTTGLSAEQFARLSNLGNAAPVLYSANFSYGIALLKKIFETFSDEILGEYEIEMVEKHHSAKADAPSGTAKMLAQALDPQNTLRKITGREGFVGARSKDEMGLFALRGGTVAGEHEVFLFGQDETLSFCHRAASRRIFATGAVKAAAKLAEKSKGFYKLEEVLF